MAHPLVDALKPAGLPWQPLRSVLAALVWLPALLSLTLPQAALFGLGVFLALVTDSGATRAQRLEHMLVGFLSVIVGALAGYFASLWSPALWWWGLLIGFAVLGAAFNAGAVLEIQLRNIGLGYLVGKLPVLVPMPLLPYALLGGACAALASLCFAPAHHNPFPMPQAPFWRHDLAAGWSGRFAGLQFGLLLSLCVAISVAIAFHLELLSPAVAGTTALFVLRPDHSRTRVLLWQRLCGVLLASLAAFAVFRLIGEPLACALIAACCLVALPKAVASGMAWMVLNNTLLLLMLLGMLGLQGQGALSSIEFRVLDTLVGCAAAGAGCLIWMRLDRAPEVPRS